MLQLSQKEIVDLLPNELIIWSADYIRQCDFNLPTEQFSEKLMVHFSKVPQFIKKNKLCITPQLFDNYYSLTELCRINILLTINTLEKTNFPQLMKNMIRFSDDDEKQSITKGIILLDPDGLLFDNMVELCRTNSTELLSSLALDNPYPAKYFPEINFNQLVLKSLFCGLDIGKVINLDKRKNSELSRMAEDYKEERINASRSVPNSLSLAL